MMAFKEGTSKGGGTEWDQSVRSEKGEALPNGCLNHGLNGKRSSNVNKRRKLLKGKGKVVDHVNEAASIFANKTSCKNSILEEMYQSFRGNESGVQGCLRDAIEFCSETESRAGSRYRNKHSSQKGKTANGTHHTDKAHNGDNANEPISESKSHSVTEMCQDLFFKILVSDKFTELCKLLEDLRGYKIDSLFQLNLVNSRMTDGSYEKSPILLATDIQQVWRRFHGIGKEMMHYADCLSDTWNTFCTDQFSRLESDSLAKGHPEANRTHSCKHCGVKADASQCLICDCCEDMYHVSCIEPAIKKIPENSWYCPSCASKGTDLAHQDCVVCERLSAKKLPIDFGTTNLSLVVKETLNGIKENPNSEVQDSESEEYGICRICDTNIEEGGQFTECDNSLCQQKYFHLRCLTKKQLRLLNGSSWYCPSCIKSEGICTNAEFQDPVSEESSICRVCGIDVADSGQFRNCNSFLCRHKFYHIRCLTEQQLKMDGSTWNCPSCLCQSCLTKKDDDKIVLCGGCNEAYHIYCTVPLLTSVPSEKWFCRKCDAAIQKIRDAKLKYEKYLNQQESKGKKVGSRW